MKVSHSNNIPAIVLAIVPMCLVLIVAPVVLAQSNIDELGAILLDPDKSEKRKLIAATSLIERFNGGEAKALAYLDNALGGPDGEIPANAKPVLYVLESKEIPEPLHAVVIEKLGSENADVRKAAEKAITSEENRKSDKLYSAILATLKDETKPDTVRISAARIIGNSHRRTACATLVGVLNGKGGLKEKIRIEVVRALGSLGNLKAVEPLIDILGKYGPPVDRTAAGALYNLTYHNFGTDGKKWKVFWDKNRTEDPTDLMKKYIEALQHDRAQALIAKLRDKPAFDVIMEVLDGSSSDLTPRDRFGGLLPDLVGEAVAALIKAPPDEEQFNRAIPRLIEMLLSDDVRIRSAVLDYFSNRGAGVRQHIDSIGPLLDRYLDSAEENAVKDKALAALQVVISKVRGPGSLKLKDGALLVRLETAMIAAIEDSPRERRLQAVEILGAGMRTVSGLIGLARFLEFDEKPSGEKEGIELRRSVAYSINAVLEGNIGLKLGEEQKRKLAVALGRAFLEDAKVSADLARPLANLGYTGGIVIGADEKFTGVSELLESRLARGVDRELKQKVLEAFSKLTDPNPEGIIIEALGDEEKIDPKDNPATGRSLTETAIITLRTVGRENAFTFLLENRWVQNSNQKIRIEAWKALAGIGKNLLDNGRWDLLAEKEETFEQAAAAIPNGDRAAVENLRDTIKKACGHLEQMLKDIEGNLKAFDSDDKAATKKAREAIFAHIGRNEKTTLYHIAGTLKNDSGYSDEIKDAVRGIIAEKTGNSEVIEQRMNYPQCTTWLNTYFSGGR